jgi:hypothetical protein
MSDIRPTISKIVQCHQDWKAANRSRYDFTLHLQKQFSTCSIVHYSDVLVSLWGIHDFNPQVLLDQFADL